MLRVYYVKPHTPPPFNAKNKATKQKTITGKKRAQSGSPVRCEAFFQGENEPQEIIKIISLSPAWLGKGATHAIAPFGMDTTRKGLEAHHGQAWKVFKGDVGGTPARHLASARY